MDLLVEIEGGLVREVYDLDAGTPVAYNIVDWDTLDGGDTNQVNDLREQVEGIIESLPDGPVRDTWRSSFDWEFNRGQS